MNWYKKAQQWEAIQDQVWDSDPISKIELNPSLMNDARKLFHRIKEYNSRNFNLQNRQYSPIRERNLLGYWFSYCQGNPALEKLSIQQKYKLWKILRQKDLHNISIDQNIMISREPVFTFPEETNEDY